MKDSKHCNWKRIEVRRWCSLGKVERSTKQLHPQECKYQDEEKQQQQQWNDGFHGTQKGYDQVSQGRPIPKREKAIGIKCILKKTNYCWDQYTLFAF